jgi:hypothetical protein
MNCWLHRSTGHWIDPEAECGCDYCGKHERHQQEHHPSAPRKVLRPTIMTLNFLRFHNHSTRVSMPAQPVRLMAPIVHCSVPFGKEPVSPSSMHLEYPSYNAQAPPKHSFHQKADSGNAKSPNERPQRAGGSSSCLDYPQSEPKRL